MGPAEEVERLEADCIDFDALEQIDSRERSRTRDFLRKTLSSYLEESTRLGRQMEHAIREHDSVALREVAHSLKSSSAQIGANRLSEICNELEEVGRTGNVEGAARSFKRLCDEYVIVRDRIREELIDAAVNLTLERLPREIDARDNQKFVEQFLSRTASA